VTGAGLALAVAALACVGGAALSDVRRFEIPDAWSIAVVVLFAAFVAVEWPMPGWWLNVVAGVVMFGVGVALFARGWLGGGDVKLLGACALWTGFEGLPWLIAGTTLSGALLAIVALTARRIIGSGVKYRALEAGGPLPYAVAILGGAGAYAIAVT
jgi:prepilin peptidase CpaA